MAKPKPQLPADPAAGITRGGSYVITADGKAERKEFTAPKPADLSPEPKRPDVAATIATE